MHGPQMLHRMCESSENKAVYVLAAILLVRLFPANEIFPHWCFNLYTQISHLRLFLL